MTDTEPAFDELKRGHVVLAPDQFTDRENTTRPWVVVNTEAHPFDSEQYIVMALTTKTWYDKRIPLDTDDYRHRQAPRDSSIVPHAIASIQPSLISDYLCRIRDAPLDNQRRVLKSIYLRYIVHSGIFCSS